MSLLDKFYHCAPTACTLFMCSSCNYTCQNCSRSIYGGGESREMSVAVVERVLSLYPTLRSFTLAGFGEPTLCSDFTNIVTVLRSGNKSIDVITNGSHLDPIVKCCGRDMSVTISLYGYDNISYQKNTGSGSFDNVIENFKKFKGSCKQVGFSLVVDRSSLTELPRYLELFERLSPDFVVMVNYLAYDGDDQESISKILIAEDQAEFMSVLKNFQAQSYVKKTPVFIDFNNPKLLCQSYNYLINVDGNGDIGGCQRQILPGSRFGNIFDTNDPFNSDQMISLRKKCGKRLIHEECRYCFGNWVNVGVMTRLERSRFGLFGKIKRVLR